MGNNNKNMKYAAAFGIVVVLLAFFYYGGASKLPTGSVTQTPTSTFGSTTPVSTATTPPPANGALSKSNPVTISLSHKDAGASSSLTEATNVKTTALYPNGLGGYVPGPATASSAISYFMPDDTGFVYLSFETQASGQAYIFDPVKTQQVNAGRDIQCTYMDWDIDGAKEYVCKISTSGLAGQYALTQSATLPLTIMWNKVGWVTLSAPSDVSSIGSTAGTATFTEYTLTGTKAQSVYLTKITIQNNSTAYNTRWNEGDEYVKIKDIPGLQWSLTPSPTPYTDNEGKQYTVTRTTDGTNTTYEIFYGTHIDQAKKIDLANNGSGTLNLEVKNVWNTPGNIVQTLKVDGSTEIDTGAQTERTDSVTYTT